MSDESKMGRPPVDGGLVYPSLGITKHNLDYLRRIRAALELRSLSEAARVVLNRAEDNNIVRIPGPRADIAPEQQG